ncbi:ATP-dependent Clp protease ATP-binding subunit [Oscillospiraceae bacterium MB08-C2-2]|nr:ATP-dependent Clp protease ATP-binding subunit [Oscillospiraceae bacterium MB08-C2-2]
MFRFSGFTQKANNAINVAMNQAANMGHTYVGSEHLILGMLDEGSGTAYTVLSQKNVTYAAYEKCLVTTVGKGEKTALTPEDFTPRCKKILEMSIIKARMLGQSYVGTEHILMVLIKETDSYGLKLLKDLGCEPDNIYNTMTEAISSELSELNPLDKNKRNMVRPPKTGTSRTPSLDKYSQDLTDQARFGNLDPVIGREQEVERLIQILSRRTKNNPCLIGEAGVGKTAIVEGLAQRIVNGMVPDSLQGKRLVTLDLTSMVAGAKYRGDFEDRIKSVLQEVSGACDVILFIDEIHTIMGAGAAEGAIDAANILKPQLARGSLQLIGATTIAEYRKHIEKDSALERRFQSIMVDPPNEEDTICILKGLRSRYEQHHRIKITDEAILAAVDLSSKYIQDRYLPDKAIDLIDEAASRVKLKTFTGPRDISDMELRLTQLRSEKEGAINSQDFELAAGIRDRERQLHSKISGLRMMKPGIDAPTERQVTREDIAQLVAASTGIQVESLTQEQNLRLINLEQSLHKRVIGQQEAVAAVSNAIRRSRVGLKDPHRPIGSFIFLGPTGVGKTELCLALAESLFSKKDSLIRLDMSEYMEKHAVSKLTGSPPGYIGYDDGGQLTERVRRKPYSVLLFDEMEKAHPDVFNLLLQILEDGILTDAQGRTVSFKNTVIIMTSNLGARHIVGKKSFGFTSLVEDLSAEHSEMKRDVMNELKQTFKPEFITRVDEIIVFNKLTQEEIKKIAEKLFGQLAQRTKEMGINLEFTESAVEQISLAGFDLIYGARPLRRAVQQKIEDRLAEKILAGQIKSGESLVCDFKDEFVFLKS